MTEKNPGDLVTVADREAEVLITAALRAAYPDEIRSIVSQSGRPEIGLDPAAVNTTECYVYLTEPEHWTKAHTKEELIEGLGRIGREVLPGTIFVFSQPIELRINEKLRLQRPRTASGRAAGS